MRLLVIVLVVSSWACLGASRLPIRNYLEGYTIKSDGSVVQGYVAGGQFHKGMGIENPGLVELMSLAYGALSAVEKRVTEASDLLDTQLTKNSLKASEKTRLLQLLRKNFVLTETERTALKALEKANLPAKDKIARREELVQKRLSADEKAALTELLAKVPEAERAGTEKLARYANRAKVQYFLALEVMKELVHRSMLHFDLRGYAQQEAGKAILYQADGDENQRNLRDVEMKKYIVDRAGELYLGALKFLSLRQNPMPGEKAETFLEESPTQSLEKGDLEKESSDPHVYLDFEIFQLGAKAAGVKFLTASPSEVPYYLNQNLIPAAQVMADGYKRLLTASIVEKKGEAASALHAMNLNEPSLAQKEALAKQIIDANILKQIPNDSLKKTTGLVTFYLHCIGAMVDSFNVNTHDSFEVMRTAVYTLLRHVVDIEGHSGWNKTPASLRLARDYVPFLEELPNYMPVKDVLNDIRQRRWEIYLDETKTGPLLKSGNHQQEQKKEYGAYHPDELRELFGVDYSNFVFPMALAWDKENDPRVKREIPVADWRLDPESGRKVPEIRKLDGTPVNEAKDIQDGDVWAELGTGVGSELISLATAPAIPSTRVKSFLAEPSVWNVAKEKMYDWWTSAIAWSKETTKKLTPDFIEQRVNIDRFFPMDQPGKGINYTGFSHVGLVEVFGDASYPEMMRADFIDAFPNRMRQAWRAHGWGFSHARKTGLFRLRAQIGKEHTQKFAARYAATVNALKGNLWKQLPPDLHATWSGLKDAPDQAFDKCRDFTSVQLPKLLPSTLFDDPDSFEKVRAFLAPVHKYCQAAFKLYGLNNFKRTVLDKGGASWTGVQIVKEMGKQAVEIGRNIRNQRPGFEGMGTRFDDRFDSMTNNNLYCSEFVAKTYLLGTGLDVWEESFFKQPIKKILELVPEDKIVQFSNGFFKVPYTEKDSVYAPQDIIYTDFGRSNWQAILVGYYSFFGVNDE